MSDGGRRVALLARPGAALDNVRGALQEIGAQIVCEGDPTKATPESVRESVPDVLMIVLDAVSEGALDRFDSVLDDPSIEVMFEEADVAAGRDGWEAARWRRHLSAKLGHRSDVLPPVAGAALAPSDGAASSSSHSMAGPGIGEFPAAELANPPPEFGGGDGFSTFDPAAAEAAEAGGDHLLAVGGLDFDPGAMERSSSAAGGVQLDDAAFGSLPQLGDGSSDAAHFDPLHAEFDVVSTAAPRLPSGPGVVDAEWTGELSDPFAAADSHAAADPAGSAVPPPLPPSGFGELSLVEDAAPAAAGTPSSRAVQQRDLGELDRRISSLELVDDAAPGRGASGQHGSAPQPVGSAEEPVGAVLVLAGIGGPDAVRQLLGALPGGFTPAVLVRQRLDGSRYDKLVAQLQRASSLPVTLARPGDAVRAGHVYVLGDDIGLAEGGSSFIDGSDDGLVGRLPPAASAVIVLSGADAGQTDAIAALIAQGTFVGAQAAEGCYDAAAAAALTDRGASTAPPAELAAQLVGRWAR